MANLAVLQVLDVLDVRESKRVFNGITYTDHWAGLSIQGGTINVRFDPELVDLPVGWSGTAICELKTFTSFFVDKDGKEKIKLNIYPSTVTSFDKQYKHPDLNDIAASLKG